MLNLHIHAPPRTSAEHGKQCSRWVEWSETAPPALRLAYYIRCQAPKQKASHPKGCKALLSDQDRQPQLPAL